ncbi:hypothetical protein GH714_020893 [Hevea brasiliensis]|uniref:Terpene synthase metal-binding domain-containing protein n=1 Tax=Hevea brasiliensis TaxID=3981 RepID=A0A6A6K6C2_HEVBR|nr:hypothetical protein GH714_020893 [Hevea brasiliensis]
MGNFKMCLSEDWEGMLSLYEASFLSEEGESILQFARDFTTTSLKKYVEQSEDQNLSMIISHALELPLHWRMLRLESRWWWRNTGLGEKLSFARDRIVENFLWTIGETFEPQFSYCRRMSTKVNSLLTTIDDIYDVYGTLDELELFTDAVQSWQTYANHTYWRPSGTIVDIHKFTRISRQRMDLFCSSCDAGPCLFSCKISITNDALKCLEEYSNVIRCSSMIVRLADDLGTSSDELKRGDVPKSIQCYMHETGASEAKARDHIRFLISETWNKMNKERVADSPFSETFIGVVINLARWHNACTSMEMGMGLGTMRPRTMF